MGPTFLSSKALLQLQNFAEIAFLKSAHFSHTAESNSLNNSLFQYFISIIFILMAKLLRFYSHVFLCMCLPSSFNDLFFQKKKKD